MKLLITGGAGFLGARLARQLLAKGQLAGSALTQVVLADQFPAPADLAADPRVEVLTGPLLEQCAGFAPIDQSQLCFRSCCACQSTTRRHELRF